MSLSKRPSRPLINPSDAVATENGKLPPDKLVNVLFHGSGLGKLRPLTARAWFWMMTLCLNETGYQLTISSVPDAYRTYGIQEWAFRDRFRTPWNPLCSFTSRTWLGKVWWLLRGKALAATPGKSNHGQGLALDVFVWEQVKGVWVKSSITKYPLLHEWLVVNAPTFGFYWNVASEAWHMEFCLGDTVPQRVLDIEAWLGAMPKT
jgi:hypothetical protein